ncbi:hypothetical protein BDD43_2796 [Mucilaginibacter gracilis]|uniref:Outer membrane protein with beta-barrel domain n=1 Tax=Mucilaginibacter gracilis TaxID=423350 RepID=A0A495J1V0_9SPHI|nr:hypothetical protein [Mucilaginibacter gracilis]RKR82611.1 hypothetical protein BDD43_2796 [Mucilaginibacter gracilis]
MNEDFDDSLKSRIQDVFDNYEDDSAHEGWLLLREKYPEKEKRRGIIWLWWGGVAAVLLIFLGIALWLNGNSALKNNFVKHSHATHTGTDIKGRPINKDTVEHQKYPLAANNKKTNINGNNTTNQTPVGKQHNYAKRMLKTTTAHSMAHQYISKNGIGTHQQKSVGSVEGDSQQHTAQTVKPGSTNTPIAEGQNIPKETPIVNGVNDSAKFAGTQSQPKPAETVKPPAKELKRLTFIAQNPIGQKNKNNADNAVKFGVYAATYFNYAKGSDNEFNVGAGLSSEIKLVGRLKLLTGVAINQNSLNYQSAIPAKADKYLAYSIADQSRGLLLYSTPPPSGGIVVTASASPILQNYQASLIGLDIPLNLKYQFNQNDTYVAAGFSSGTYINETYNFVYKYPSNTINTSNQNTKTKAFFNTFDFARTLNLSFGVGYPLGKKNTLIIEPFFKYPLDGLGSQDLKFGAGGVNLKLNLHPNKKQNGTN